MTSIHQSNIVLDGAIPENITRAATLLRGGGLVAFPTETVYGLGANAADDTAVAAIFAAKRRPEINPLIVHAASLETIFDLGTFNDTARRLAEAHWPGGLTLVVPRTSGCPVSLLATAGLDTIALRVPAHPVAQALLIETGIPLAAPSANISGRVSAVTADHVCADLEGSLACILDAGATPLGLESAIVSCLDNAPVLLRPGAIAREALERTVDRALGDAPSGGQPLSPGQLERHYAPDARLRLNATIVEPGEALLGFGPDLPPASGPVLNLSARGDLREAAANLFRHLRSLDAMAPKIAVMPIPNEGLGEAINDRLRRGATGGE